MSNQPCFFLFVFFLPRFVRSLLGGLERCDIQANLFYRSPCTLTPLTLYNFSRLISYSLKNSWENLWKDRKHFPLCICSRNLFFFFKYVLKLLGENNINPGRSWDLNSFQIELRLPLKALHIKSVKLLNMIKRAFDNSPIRLNLKPASKIYSLTQGYSNFIFYWL